MEFLSKPGNKDIVIPQHPVPNPTQLASILTESKFFTVINWCSALFHIPVDNPGQFYFAFTWEEQQYTWAVMPQSFNESSYFSQTLKADLDDIKFSKGSALLQ